MSAVGSEEPERGREKAEVLIQCHPLQRVFRIRSPNPEEASQRHCMSTGTGVANWWDEVAGCRGGKYYTGVLVWYGAVREMSAWPVPLCEATLVQGSSAQQWAISLDRWRRWVYTPLR